MWPSVSAAFPSFTERFEGRVPFMYLDVLGLVTTGRGNLIDPSPMAMVLPWRNPDGSLALRGQVANAWMTVKQRGDLKLHGGMAFGSLTNIRLSDADIDLLTLSKCLANENYLKGRFNDWDCMPADAQLGVLSMAWACGPMFRFPKFEAALRYRDWSTCAAECEMNATGNPGLVPRNVANKQLFTNAAASADPSVLIFSV